MNSHDLGLLGLDKDTGGQRRSLMIPRNSRLPVKKGKRFATSRPNQASVSVKIVEGGDDAGRHSTLIGNCVVRDLPPHLPAATAVDVFFNYGDDGRLHVTAALPSIGTKAEMTIERESGLSNQDLEYWTHRVHAGLLETASQAEPITVVTPGRKETWSKVNITPVINITAAKSGVASKSSVIPVSSPAKAAPAKTGAAATSAAMSSTPQAPTPAKTVAEPEPVRSPQLTNPPATEKPATDAPAAGGWKSRRQQIKPGETL